MDGIDDVSTLSWVHCSSLYVAGFTGDSAPRAVFPAIVGRPRSKPILGMGVKDAYVGDEAQSKRGILVNKDVLNDGTVVSWDDMEKLWHHAFYNELRVAPEEHPLSIAMPTRAPRADREKLCQIMFETFMLPALFVSDACAMAMISAGRTSGIVVDCGKSSCRVVPIVDSFAMSRCAQYLNLGGRHIDESIMAAMNKRSNEGKEFPMFTSAVDREIIRDIKEKHGYIALDYDAEVKRLLASEPQTGWDYSNREAYELPDGGILNVRMERFQHSEALFQPKLLGVEGKGIHQLTQDVIADLDPLFHADPKPWYGNIVVSGGTSMFEGLADRLQKEVIALAGSASVVGGKQQVRVVAPPERKYSTWIGVSILTSLSTMRDMWMTRQQYDEFGPTAIHRLCI